jgi:hypothetical protein
LLSWLFHDDDDDHRPLASAQLPAAAFPATYAPRQYVPMTAQGSAGACDTSDKTTKKPCFLKVWLHDLKHGHDDDGSACGHCGACASSHANVTGCETAKAPKKPCFLKVWLHDLKCGGHGSHCDDCAPSGATASPQGPNVCETAAKAPKKPCFLKVWIHDWKASHGSGCGNCQKGNGACCQQTCKCSNGSGAAPAASPQGPVASAPAAAQGYTKH